LRPSAAIQLYPETGGNLRKVQQFLQHARLSTTMRYLVNSITEPFHARVYEVPECGPAKLEYRGLPLDEIEDLLPRSSAYRQAARILFPQPAAIKGRPLTPLHGGHVALCAVSGMLNGVFGSGKDLHVAAWQAVKVVDKSEETEEDGTIIKRERERFTNELTLVYASGETAILR
jgi:hypothetical protein